MPTATSTPVQLARFEGFIDENNEIVPHQEDTAET
jgi:hypothetical protein